MLYDIFNNLKATIQINLRYFIEHNPRFGFIQNSS